MLYIQYVSEIMTMR